MARACPLCGLPPNGTVVAEQRIDPAALGAFAFASRKEPEYMHYRLVACPGCDLVYASPAPEPETLAGAYLSADFDSGEESRWAARTYGWLVSPVLPRLPERRRALDVGAGDGAFIEELLRLGFAEIVGVEPSDAPRASAKPDIRPHIRGGLFSSEAFAGERFDLITCFQTIEHVHDPLGVCREALSLLEDGGAFVIVCHNRRALSAKVMGRRSPIFDVEHLQLFSPASLRRLLSEAGFTGVSAKVVWNRYPARYWARLAPLPAPLKAWARTLLAGGLGSFGMTLPAGNLAAVGFRPGGR